MTGDRKTAAAFATSWNHLPSGSVYTIKQFEQWLLPHTAESVQGKSVLELGCGNGSLLVHMARWQPSKIVGVDLGSCVDAAKQNMRRAACKNFEIVRADLHEFAAGGFDLVYCIGVLHHLMDPHAGFTRVVDNVKPGGWFHCSVYAHEGNGIVRTLVEPLRRVCSRLPWWLTKYIVATPLSVPFYAYSKFMGALPSGPSNLPMYAYTRSIAEREFPYFRHIAFDQLVTPRTIYVRRSAIEHWLASDDRIAPASTYVEMRHENSWKFGGRRK